jgi:hypothetical protein
MQSAGSPFRWEQILSQEAHSQGVLKPDLTEQELLATVAASALAGHKAASTKRVQRVLDGSRKAVLYRIQDGKVAMADPTRKSLAAYFGI